MWPFGKKVACFQCDRKVKESKAILRRGFSMCSPACVTAFLAANTFPRPPGDEEQLRLELGNRLVAALGELHRIPGVPPLRTRLRQLDHGGFNAVAGAAVAHNRAEEAEDAVVQFNAHATAALPYLAALSLSTGFELLDTLDVDALTRAAKWLNFEPIVKLQNELAEILETL